MFWGHIILLWERDVAHAGAISAASTDIYGNFMQ